MAKSEQEKHYERLNKQAAERARQQKRDKTARKKSDAEDSKRIDRNRRDADRGP